MNDYTSNLVSYVNYQPIYMPNEIVLSGPVQYRWMYSFERQPFFALIISRTSTCY
ncbi:hypothetical protein CR513_41274, partial [Mucuna pruriens]